MQLLFKQAQALHQQGQLTEAADLYRQVVQASPRFAEAYHLLGLALSQQGQHAAGIEAVLQAIQIQPIHPPYYNNLGLMYAKSADWTKALEAYRAATRIAPAFAEAWFNTANAYKNLNQTDKAIKTYEKVLKLDPRHVRAAYNLGNTLLEMGKPKSARTWFEKAIALKPDYAEAHNNLGSALTAWDELDLAFVHYQKAVDLKADFTDALKNLGNAYLSRGDYQKGRTLMYESIVKQNQTGWEDLILASLSPVIFEDRAAIDTFFAHLQQTLDAYRHKDLSLDMSTLHDLRLEPASGMPYQGVDIKAIQISYGQVFDRHLPKIERTKRAVKSKPHIGFVVTNGHEGVFIKCMRGILNHINTQRFDVTVVCSLPNGEAIIKPAIENRNIAFLGLPKQLDKAMLAVAETDFDALHYWEVGTDYQNYFLPFCRLAPVQCTSWGWPVTSGNPQMDYFLSAEGLETAEADAHYSENLIRFKKLPVYYYRPLVPQHLEPIETFGLPTNTPVYLVVQNLRKVHPDFDDLIKNILEKDTNGIVVFIKDKQDDITRLLHNRLIKTVGAAANRLHFVERMDESRYLNLLALADVILDTVHYTGGANTAYDAFAAATPYVTLPTAFHRGRYGLAAYQQIGIEDGIATDAADYVEKAVRIANDTAYRQNLSDRIKANSYKVFEDMEAVRELEAFFMEKCPRY
jgi:protein O-GlcNAc transferase